MNTPVAGPPGVLVLSGRAQPDADLCTVASSVGTLGVLDVADGATDARRQLHRLARLHAGPLALRVDRRWAADPVDLATLLATLPPGAAHRVRLVLLAPGVTSTGAVDGIRIAAEVDSPAAARAALAAGADALVACGSETGIGTEAAGGTTTAFVLLQQLLRDAQIDAPVWVRGGIGPHTAAAAVAGGAAGVVLAPDAPERGTGRAIAAVLDAVATARHRPFALTPHSPMAEALGTELPVAQGPMTRVSDEPSFARAVAAAGALPFLALALADKAQSRRLLERTRDELGERPWGVGLLGFADAQLRADQLEVVHEVRPQVAIIAGGNPAQAAELDRAGIATFLHVTSGELLAGFVEAGARRFVFEGSECGGHVGPRTSFELWQDQIDVLLAAIAARPQRAGELQVLFAGGIHDARSAAMVSALAHPLTELGVAVGVVMGTAYLFTAEAVERGAVQSQFQQRALASGGTTVIESAPGHAIRCLPSPFVTTFTDTRERLLASGTDRREVWQQLDDLNTGRLRVASKGIRRHDGALVGVDEHEQWADGLYMAGQVTALRDTVVTVQELHDDVVRGGRELHAHLAAETPRAGEHTVPPEPLDVAIVGMACVLPGAPDLETYWTNTVANVDCVREVPVDRWDPADYFNPDPAQPDPSRSVSKWGGFLDPVPFDALRYGIPPSVLGTVEPVQLLALDVAQRALDDAGYGDGGFDRDRTSVIFGAEAGSDLNNANIVRMTLRSYLGELPAELDEQLPPLTEDSFAGSLSNVISGRIANRLDLRGANYTVDAACGSSLAALDAAAKELVSGHSDVVLCGAADLHNAASDYLLFNSVGALSPSGRSATFDTGADGIALGEGVVCLVLKRLTDAERAGDRIYAVVKGVGSSSDGHALGLTAPRPEGQQRALERAYERAGITADRVGLLEAHGTGTVVGDRTELTTLQRVYRAAGAAPGSCTLGSVKSQIGHTKCAAGLAGLVRAALAVHTGVKPPTQHVGTPNPAWTPDGPFALTSSALPWLRPATERIAAVSAFGFGGTNFHAVLQGHPSAALVRSGLTTWPAELFVFRGADRAAALRAVERVRGLATRNDTHGRPWTLADLARTAAGWADSAAGDATPVQLAAVVTDLDHLARVLLAASTDQDADGLIRRDGSDPGALAVLFPGQGSQQVGMLADLFVAFPWIQEFGRDAAAVADVMYPAGFGPRTADEQRAALQDTRMAQPALGIAGLAVHALLRQANVVPDMLAGHSYGELVALCAAGAYAPSTLTQLSVGRAQAIMDAVHGDPGTMAAVAATAADVDRVLADASLNTDVVIANHNGPRQVVISGPTPALELAVQAMRSAGLGATALRVACAFHSQVVAGGAPLFAATLAAADITAPDTPVWSNRTTATYRADADAVRAELTEQLRSPVRFVEQIEAMYAAGARTFVEAGPGRTLTRLVDAILGDRPHTRVSTDGGVPGLLTALATLAVRGSDLRMLPLLAGRAARDVSGLEPPRPAGWRIDGRYVRTAAGEPVAGGLTPARRITTALRMTTGPTTQSPMTEDTMTPQSEADNLVTEFLRSSREIVAAQRDVLLGYLGTAGTPSTLPQPVPLAPTVAAVVPVTVPVAVPVAVPPEPVATDPLTVVVDVIAQRTGYPVDMIEADLDLEAELSIDSIKRTEIGAQACRTLGIGAADPRFDAVVKQRTARAMAAVLDTRTVGPEPVVPAETDSLAETDSVADADIEAPVASLPAERYQARLVTVPPAQPEPAGMLTGAVFAVHGGDDPLVDALQHRLTAAGAELTRVASAVDLPAGRLDGVLLLRALDGDPEPVLPASWELLQRAVSTATRWVYAVSPTDDDLPRPAAAGLRGAFRTLAQEHLDLRVRLVELDWTTTTYPVAAADLVLAELLEPTGGAVVAPAGGTRRAFAVEHAPFVPAEDLPVPLGPDSVVLVVGGARGIAAGAAIELARHTGCRLELAGRTVLEPEASDAAFAAATDLAAVRSALAGLGRTGPAAIDAEARDILARREVTATLTAIRAHGGQAEYRTVDVRDAAWVASLVKQVHAESKRLDAVIFSAGVIEDKLFVDKSLDSLDRVFATKVEGASALLDATDDLPARPALVVLFGSIAAVTGSRGQVDYAAANDALETLAATWSRRTGARSLVTHWGPWAPSGEHAGMVSPELARDYARRGVALLDPTSGVAALLTEMAAGEQGATATVLAAPSADLGLPERE